MFKIRLIGVGADGLRAQQKADLEGCLLIAGSSRHLGLVADLAGEKRGITPLAETLAAIREALPDGNVGVLAGGDPLFYGIGRRLLEEFGAATVEVRPALSSLQEACARFKIPWDEASVGSLHGRSSLHPAGDLLRNDKTLVLTDRLNSPDSIAGRLIAYLKTIGADDLVSGYRVHVAENLGSSLERLVTGSLAEIASAGFADLNVMLLTGPKGEGGEGGFGLEEERICHSRGLITKDEVRAVTLHKLFLPAKGVFWDLGAGSGSVALEAARLNPDLVVYAVEQKAMEMENIKENIRRYRCFNIIPVHGRTPEILENLPEPDRIFVGGSGGSLAEIIKQSALRLPAGGRLVVNGVTAQTVKQAPEVMAGQGLEVELCRVEVEKRRYPDGGGGAAALNPITVMTGIRSPA